MKKIPWRKLKQLLVGTLLAAILVYLFGVSTDVARFLTLLAAILIPAILLSMAFNQKDWSSIFTVAAPVLSSFYTLFAKTGLADNWCAFCNDQLAQLSGYLGLEKTLSVDAKVCLQVSLCVTISVICLVTLLIKRSKNRKKEPAFRESDYSAQCQSFRKTLRQRMERINRDTDWNESTFTPLEAEIEVCIDNSKTKKFGDLSKCLKAYRKRSTFFLIKGEPGAGKSVAMRKLCLDLLDDPGRAGLVPVYVDLKTWNKPWSLEHPPGRQDLLDFLIETLKEGDKDKKDDFIDSYFQTMLNDGRWYFIFDSFDELPCLNGKEICDKLIDRLSTLFYEFLTAANQPGGVIASRLVHAPSGSFRHAVTMTIQPFSDIKIKNMLRKYTASSRDIERTLFGERNDLVALCRNPFHLSLLCRYIRDNGGSLPKNQMELYESFVKHTLLKYRETITDKGLTIDQVRDAAASLALYMNQSEAYGLEYPLQELLRQKEGKSWRILSKLLAEMKLCRFSEVTGTLSFVHRRFQEFFYVDQLLSQNQQITREHYPSIRRKSGMRDALVLYCEIADDAQAEEIAGYCWDTIRETFPYRKSIQNQKCRELVNTLYFMAEAFRNRRGALAAFQNKFQLLVRRGLHKTTDLAVLLALTQSMVLFEQDTIQQMVLRVLKLRNRWLTDVVMLNCRAMGGKLNPEIEAGITTYFRSIPMGRFLAGFRNTDFSLSISKTFGYIRLIHLIRLCALFCLAGILALSICGWILAVLVVNSGGLMEYVQAVLRFTSGSPITIPVNDPYGFFWILTGWLFGLLMLGEFLNAFLEDIAVRRPLSYALLCMLIASYVLWSALLDVLVLLAISPAFRLAWTLLAILTVLVFLVLKFDSHRHDLRVFKRFYLLLREHPVVFFLGIALWIPSGYNFDTIAILAIKVLVCFWVLLLLLLLVLLFVKPKETAAALWEPIRTGIQNICAYFIDWRWVRREKVAITRITREKLAQDLKKHFTRRWQIVYIDSLVRNKVELTGDWPDGARPLLGYDDMDHKLMELDCAGYDDLIKRH